MDHSPAIQLLLAVARSKHRNQIGPGQFSWFSRKQTKALNNRRVFSAPSHADRARSKALRNTASAA